MSLLDQDSIEGSLLCILYEKVNGRNHFTTVEQVAANFRPPLTGERVQIGFDALVERGVADLDAPGLGGYKINKTGIDWVEEEFAIGADGEIHQFRRRRRGNPLPSKTSASRGINWTKWGTILTGAGIIVAIIIAVI